MTGGTAFIGHILPGSFFIVFSLWWLVCIFLKYRRCIQRNKPFYSSASYQLAWTPAAPTKSVVSNGNNSGMLGSDGARLMRGLCCCCVFVLGRLPIEGAIKLLAAVVGTLGELATGWDPHRARFRPSGTQHMTMYLLYGVSGLADILVFGQAYFVPRSFEYTGLLFAFGGEALLLFLHSPHGSGGHEHHGDPVEMSCHQLLFFTILGCFLLLLAEHQMPHSLMVTVARAYGLLFHGVWFSAVGFILAPPWSDYPEWDLHDAENVMYIVAIFSWIAMGLVVFVLLLAAYLLWPAREQLRAINARQRIQREMSTSPKHHDALHIDPEEQTTFDYTNHLLKVHTSATDQI